MPGECVLGRKAREDPERVDRLGHTAGERDIDLPEPQHLDTLDQAGITRRAGGPDRIVWADQAQIDRHLPGRVIRPRPVVVMVRPELYLIIVLTYDVNLVLGFYRAVLGNSHIRTDPRAVKGCRVDAGTVERLAGTVDCD